MPGFRWNQSAICTTALVFLALLALVGALKIAEALVAPIALGLVMAVILAPILRKMRKLGVRPVISAAVVLFLTASLLIVVVSFVGPIITQLLELVPKIEVELQRWLEEALRLVRGLGNLSSEIEETFSEGSEEAVKAAVPGIVDALWLAPNFAAQLLIFSGTLFFFLLTRDELYAKFSTQTSALEGADRAVSHYFMSITLINAGMGFVVFAAMSAIGLPNPILWGAAAFFLNFILYLGPLIMILALLIAGFTQFSGVMVILPPVTFFLINVAEAQFVTPALLGQRLQMNPLCVFLSILFGLWLWGPIGGIVSLPILVWLGAYYGALRSRGDMPEAFGSTIDPRPSLN